MPWERVWIPPEDEIEVLKELPKGAKIHDGWGWESYRTARLDEKVWYECEEKLKDPPIGCGGWIEGSPHEEYENTMGPLCGREGEVYYCRRCGTELGFSGAIS